MRVSCPTIFPDIGHRENKLIQGWMMGLEPTTFRATT
jgi:hypothetical protein